jgi:hypothetical protein
MAQKDLTPLFSVKMAYAKGEKMKLAFWKRNHSANDQKIWYCSKCPWWIVYRKDDPTAALMIQEHIESHIVVPKYTPTEHDIAIMQELRRIELKVASKG